MTNQMKCAGCTPYKPMPLHCVGKRLEPVANMSDEQIARISIENAQQQAKSSKTAKVLKALPVMFATSLVAISACKMPGQLSKKLGTAAATGGTIAIGVGILKGCSKAAEKFKEKFGNKDKEEQERSRHPYLKAASSILGSIAILAGTFFGLKKGGDALLKNEKVTGFIKNTAAKIDKTKIAGRVEEFGEKYKNFLAEKSGVKENIFKKAYKGLASKAYPAAIIGYLATLFGLGTALDKKTATVAVNNMETIANIRDEARMGVALVEKAKGYIPKSDAECDLACEETDREISAAAVEIKEAEEAREAKKAMKPEEIEEDVD